PLRLVGGRVGREGEGGRGEARALPRGRPREVPRARDEEGGHLMPIQINTSVKGKEYPPYTVTVERGRIKDFARAIGDLNPHYLDDDVGRASPWDDVIAPPTFPISFRDESGDLLRDIGTDVSRLLHGEQEFEIFQQLRPGE